MNDYTQDGSGLVDWFKTVRKPNTTPKSPLQAFLSSLKYDGTDRVQDFALYCIFRATVKNHDHFLNSRMIDRFRNINADFRRDVEVPARKDGFSKLNYRIQCVNKFETDIWEAVFSWLQLAIAYAALSNSPLRDKHQDLYIYYKALTTNPFYQNGGRWYVSDEVKTALMDSKLEFEQEIKQIRIAPDYMLLLRTIEIMILGKLNTTYKPSKPPIFQKVYKKTTAEQVEGNREAPEPYRVVLKLFRVLIKRFDNDTKQDYNGIQILTRPPSTRTKNSYPEATGVLNGNPMPVHRSARIAAQQQSKGKNKVHP